MTRRPDRKRGVCSWRQARTSRRERNFEIFESMRSRVDRTDFREAGARIVPDLAPLVEDLADAIREKSEAGDLPREVVDARDLEIRLVGQEALHGDR
jgi:hypothetical protein